jgi:hypothetical protein
MLLKYSLALALICSALIESAFFDKARAVESTAACIAAFAALALLKSIALPTKPTRGRDANANVNATFPEVPIMNDFKYARSVLISGSQPVARG